MRSTSIATVAAIALASVALVAPGRGSAATEMDMEQMVTTAKTANDHQNLAKHYEAEAADARAKAEKHRKMAAAYRQMGGAIVSKLHFDEHCDALVKSFLAEAEQYDALAKAHLEMAKEAQ